MHKTVGEEKGKKKDTQSLQPYAWCNSHERKSKDKKGLPPASVFCKNKFLECT